MKAKVIGYWATTVLLALEVLVGGVWDLTRRPYVVEVMAHLGYPTYLLTILGLWKLPGGVTLLAPGLPRLKEWAYAGIFFEMTGAAASHAASGDGAGSIIPPLVFAALAIASRALRPLSRGGSEGGGLGATFNPGAR